MKNFINIKTKNETVIINKDQIVSIEIYEVTEKMDCDGEMLECPFLQVTIITTRMSYTDNQLYSEMSEIEYI
jgi:hypothetical protein